MIREVGRVGGNRRPACRQAGGIGIYGNLWENNGQRMEEKWVRRHGVSVYYRLYKGRGTPLIFLHGGGGNVQSWDMLLPYMDSKQTMVTVDLRGHGISARPENPDAYDVGEHAADVKEIVTSLGLKKIILIGHCFGGMVAIEYAHRLPDTLEKMILINTGVTVPAFIRLWPLSIVIRLAARFIADLIGSEKKSGRVDYHAFIGSSDIDIRRLWVDVHVMGIGSAAKQYLAILSWFQKVKRYTITTRTRIITSTNDTLFPHAYTAKLLHIIPHAHICRVDSNHISIINNPEPIARYIKEFIAVHASA